MVDTGDANRKGCSGWVKGALALSLGLNLLVAGTIAGAHLRGGRDFGPRGERSAVRDSGFAPFVMALEPGERRALGRQIRALAGGREQNRAALIAEMHAILAALRAEPFDPGAVRAVMSAQQGRLCDRQSRLRAAVGEHIAAMDAGARLRFAERLETVLEHGPGRR